MSAQTPAGGSTEPAAAAPAGASAPAAAAAASSSPAAAGAVSSGPAVPPRRHTVATHDPSAQQLSYHTAPSADAPGHLGCEHYRKNCLVRAPCCPSFFPCRLCHDEAEPKAPGAKESHQIDRKQINEMVCMCCVRDGRGAGVQPVAGACQDCGASMARYYCATCHLFDDDPEHDIFHCDGCGICRRGKRSDWVHCDGCTVCLAPGMMASHKCVADASKRDCAVCMSDMFGAREQLRFLRCGHALHSSCMVELLRSQHSACPLCKKSISPPSARWTAQLDAVRRARPMPREYASWRAKILCNDCLAHNEVPWRMDDLHRCDSCFSYNTDVLQRIQNEPDDIGAGWYVEPSAPAVAGEQGEGEDEEDMEDDEMLGLEEGEDDDEEDGDDDDAGAEEEVWRGGVREEQGQEEGEEKEDGDARAE